MQVAKTWRELLGSILRDAQEEQRLIDLLGVRPITLSRWVQQKSDPRPYFLRQLLAALPQQRELLLPLIEQEFPGFAETVDEEAAPREIASAFYAQVLETYSTTALSLRFWSLCPLIFQQMLTHLDPDQLGMQLILARCMPPAAALKPQIRSLREYVAMGTPPWRTDLEERNQFLGSESLAGYAVSSCHSAVIQNVLADQSLLPAQKEEYERSAAALPLVQNARVAGCLLVSSTLPNAFTAARLAILKQYTHLLVLALQPEDFFAPEHIELRMMPPQHVQQSFLATLRQRIAVILTQAKASQQPLTNQQAEQLARHQLEEELIELAL
jgi:hypothetical protein